MSAEKGDLTLLAAAQSGDEAALAAFIGQNMGLVKSIALRFRDRGAEFEDLVQIGSVGMLRAVRSFDFSFGTAFSTYAVPLIIGEIRRFLRDDGAVKVGRELRKQGAELARKREEFCRREGREPTFRELSAETGMSEEEISFALEAVTPPRSLAEPCGDDETLTLGSMLADKNDEIGGMTDRIALRQALSSLSESDRELIVLRYFRGFSQEKTGRMLGMTQVKVSRNEKRILQRLREEM